MLPRLNKIETDLLTRRSRAETEGWLGEIEGIDLTQRGLCQVPHSCARMTAILCTR